MRNIWNNETLKALAKEKNVKVTDVLALSSGVDPFYQSRGHDPPEGVLWFFRVYKWFREARPNVKPYLRRIHYAYSSLADAKRHDMRPYLNDDACWSYIKKWSLVARYCKLIKRGDLMDNRKRDPVLHADFATPHHEYSGGGYDLVLRSQSLDRLHTLDLQIGYPRYNTATELAESLADVSAREVDGIRYNVQKLQPYHLEVWIEKSSLNEDLIPVCEKFHANFIYGLGQESLTRVEILLDRILDSRKPIRIFYICDYDQQGTVMPEAVSRKIQYYNDTMHNGDLDIKLCHLGLTVEQIEKYRLPHKPTKDYKLKKTTLERLSGEEQKKHLERLRKYSLALKKRQPFSVELDALETFYPGETARLLTKALSPFYDLDLAQRIENERHSFRENLRAHIIDNVLVNEDEINDAISMINHHYKDINAKLRTLHIEALGTKEMIVESGLYGKIKRLQNEYVDLEDVDFNLPKAKVTEDFEGDWLYDNKLNYWEQTMLLKEHRKRTSEEV